MLHDCRHPHVVLMIGACLDLEHSVLPTLLTTWLLRAVHGHVLHLLSPDQQLTY